jgi:arabinofuranosyltransferase
MGQNGTNDEQDAAGVASPRQRALLAAGLVLLLVVMIRSAWISDDGLITFRTIDNLVSGEGLRFNIAERVQSYTHPLWLLLLTPVYFVTREAFYTPIFVSLGCSLLAVLVAVVRGPGRVTESRHATAAILCLIASKSFIDYTTSGLENPLSYVLVAVWLRLYLEAPDLEAPGPGALREPARVGMLVLVTSLLFVNRMDSVLLVAPALVLRVVALTRVSKLRTWAPTLLLGALPALAWVAFSLLYYGAPVSNTAYAKLYTGIDPGMLRSQGLFYLGQAVRFDPVTPAILLLAGVASVMDLRGARKLWPLGIGIALQLLYVVEIGGDFMQGRFLSVPFFAAIVMLCAVPLRRGVPVVVAAGCLVLSVSTASSPLRSGADYENRDEQTILANRGISDERGFYYARRGLLSAKRTGGLRPGSNCIADAETVVVRSVCGELGYEAFTGCRSLLLADRCALTDPLLARMPMIDPTSWRVGHYFRRVPRGYTESLEQDENLIVDEKIRSLYGDIRLATRAPLLAPGRLRAILRLNGLATTEP